MKIVPVITIALGIMAAKLEKASRNNIRDLCLEESTEQVRLREIFKFLDLGKEAEVEEGRPHP